MPNDPRHSLQNAFRSAAPLPAGFSERVNVRVARLARRRRMQSALGAALASLISVVLLVLAGREAVAETASSGFGQYLTLAFTNGGAMLADWRDFASALAESVPAWGLALVLAAAGALVAALRWAARAVGAPLSPRGGWAI